MNLFGCKFCTNVYSESYQNGSQNWTKNCERKNFDSFLWACITVFQVYKINMLYLFIHLSYITDNLKINKD